MTATIKFTDFEVSERHAEIIVSHWPDAVRVKKPELRKVIPGVNKGRITQKVRSGIWIQPLGRQTVKSWSSVRDVARSSLVVFVRGSSTTITKEQEQYEIIRELISELFDDRRGTKLCGELISRVSSGDYDMDDSVARDYDIDILKITSIFREDKTYDLP